MIREATDKDYDSIWKIFSSVIQSEDTYIYYAKTPKEDLEKYWFGTNMKTFVYEENGVILGTYILKPNYIDLAKHISNASYMVNPEAQGKGIGKQLCKHSLQLAKDLDYKGMQFNLVVSSNKSAIALWLKIGFKIIGTTPKAFKHSTKGYIDTHIMYKDL